MSISHTKRITIKIALFVGVLIVSAQNVKAQNISSDDCSNYQPIPELTSKITDPVSKYDELIKYDNWTLDDLMNFFQFAQISESAGY